MSGLSLTKSYFNRTASATASALCPSALGASGTQSRTGTALTMMSAPRARRRPARAPAASPPSLAFSATDSPDLALPRSICRQVWHTCRLTCQIWCLLPPTNAPTLALPPSSAPDLATQCAAAVHSLATLILVPVLAMALPLWQCGGSAALASLVITAACANSPCNLSFHLKPSQGKLVLGEVWPTALDCWGAELYPRWCHRSLSYLQLFEVCPAFWMSVQSLDLRLAVALTLHEQHNVLPKYAEVRAEATTLSVFHVMTGGPEL